MRDGDKGTGEVCSRILDHGYLKVVETWGSDRSIIEAARMSTDKGFQGWGDEYHYEKCPDNDDKRLTKRCAICEREPGDEKLLRYLYTHKHDSPFEFAGMVIEVQAPIFVFREWHRHRTQSHNEMSARYAEIPELFYVPTLDRIKGQGKANKQGSEGELSPHTQTAAQQAIYLSSAAAFEEYHALLKIGVARETARLVLPVNTYSRMRASANLRNWLAFLTLRLDPNAQEEIRVYAEALAREVATAFPRTYELFVEGR